MTHETFLGRAIDLAEQHSSNGMNGPFGAVVVHQGTVVGEGWNQVVENNDPTAHAEIVALRQACRRLNTFSLHNCIIYSSTEPCPMCLAAIYWSRINTVYYASDNLDAKQAGFDDQRILQELTAPWEKRQVSGHRLLQSRGKEVLQKWINNPLKKEY
jgi:tRNA(Arg) A34 adenosine deaminase TadA